MPEPTTSTQLTGPSLVPSTGAVRVALHDFGGEGPGVLIVHATGMNAWCYRTLARELEERYHCWALDLRGHGDSDPLDVNDLHWREFGEDVAAAINYISAPGGLIGVGHSLGGAALTMAAGQRADAFTQLVLFEPAVTPSPENVYEHHREHQALAVAAAARRREVFDSRPAALSNYASKLPTSQLRASVLYDYVQHGFADLEDGRVSLKCSAATEAAIYRETYNQQTRPLLGNIRCPVDVVRGGATDPAQRASAVELSSRFRRPLTIIDGVGHFGPLQDPVRFGSVIDNLVTRARSGQYTPADE